jgi:hypothetical protein
VSRTPKIRKSIVLLVSVAALAAPTAATAYPVIGDDPASDQAVAEGHAWYANYVKRLAQRTKPSADKPKPPHWPCPLSKKSCPK